MKSGILLSGAMNERQVGGEKQLARTKTCLSACSVFCEVFLLK